VNLGRLALGVLLIVALCADAAGQENARWLSGSLRSAWWSGTRNLDDKSGQPGAALWLKGEPHNPDISMVMEGWIRSERLFDSLQPRVRIREAYGSTASGSFDLRAGRQIIVWGRADQINPTDNITPRDFTMLVPDTADDRLGADAAAAVYRRNEYSLSAIWLPHFRPNTVPFPAAVAAGLRKEIPTSPKQLALKLDRSGAGGIDWSLSWFSGFDLNPTLGLDPQGTGLLERHPRIRVAGADFAVPVGRYGLRGEAAYTWTEDREGADPLKKHPFFFGVFGVERTFFDYLNVNLQYYAYSVHNYRDPRQLSDPNVRQLAVSQAILSHQLDRSERGVAVRISNKWWNETLEAEVAMLANFERRDYALKPKLTYAFSDRVKGTLGADLLRGSDDALFGRLRKNSVAYAELSYFF
jgi:hypothetical protein